MPFYTITSKEEFILVFIVSMIMLLMTIQIMEKAVLDNTKECSKDLCSNTHSFQIFANENKLAFNIFDNFISVLSALTFIALITILLFYIYPTVGFIFLFYWLSILAIFITVLNNNSRLRKKVETELNKVINKLETLCFLIIFTVVAFDFSSNEPSVTLIVAIVTLLLIRHIFIFISRSILTIKKLYDTREKIEIIFFDRRMNDKLMNIQQKKFFGIFDRIQYKEQIKSSLSSALNKSILIKKFDWYELHEPNVMAFLLTLKNSEKYLIKIFNENLNTRVLKENALLECNHSDLTLPFVGSYTIDRYYCQFYNYTNFAKIDHEEYSSSRLIMLERLSKYNLPQHLTYQYSSSYRHIHERLSKDFFKRLQLVTNLEERVILNWFEREIDKIYLLLNKLPFKLAIPNINKNVLIKDINNNVKILGFGDWLIEPIGFSFTDHPEDMKLLKKLLDKKQFISAQIVQQLKNCEHNMHKNHLKKAVSNISNIKKLQTYNNEIVK